MLCLVTLSAFFLLMQSSCPRQLFAVLSPERRVEGREEKAPVLDLLPLQSKDEGRGVRKEKGKLSGVENSTEDIWKRVFEGQKERRGLTFISLWEDFFIASFHQYFSSPSISPFACLFSLPCFHSSLCPLWNLPLFSSSPARGPWELPRMPLSLSALLPMRLYWWCTSERKRKAEIEEKSNERVVVRHTTVTHH